MKINLHVKVLLSGILCSSFIFNTQAQNNIDNGWDFFLKNDVKRASEIFLEASKLPNEKEQALLGLAFTHIYDKDELQSFKYFKEFCSTSSNPDPYINALWSTPILLSNTKKSVSELEFFKQISTQKNIDGTLNAMAFSVLGNHYKQIKKPEEAKIAYKNIGSLENWQIVGEFENISTSGFDKKHAPINNPNKDAVFINKNGAKVNWFTPPHFRQDKWIDFTNHFFAQEAIIYAQTFVESKEEKEVQLRAGVSGSLKIWVNDFLIISEEDERNNDLDNYISTIKLNKGFNRILVQVGESYASRSNFLIRITDEKGNPLGLNGTSEFREYTKAQPYNVKSIPLFAEKYLEDLNALAPVKVYNEIYLASCYLRNDKTFKARQILESLKIKYPKSTLINSLLIDLYNRTNNRTGLESIQEDIKTNDPQHTLAIELTFSTHLENKDYIKAEEELRKLENLYGANNQSVISYKIDLLAKKSEIDKLIPVAEMGYNLYPNSYQFVEYKFLIEKEIKKNNKSAIATLKKYLENNNNYTASKYLSDLYISMGEFEKGINILKDESKADPSFIGIYIDIVKNYYTIQNYAKAKEEEEKAIQQAPYVSNYHIDLAKINNSLGKKEEAIRSYKKALELYPKSYEAIKELRVLENKKPLFDYFETPDIIKIIANSPSQKDYPDDNSIILHHEVQTIIYPEGGSEEKHIMAVKILNTKGIDTWKEYSVYASGWQGYIIQTSEVVKANGQKVPGEVNYQDIVFKNLEVGDAIHITYKLENYSQGQLANKFWDTYYFSHYYPYQTIKYSLLVAKNLPFKYKFSKKDITPVKSSVEDFDMYVFETKNQEALVYEDKMPSINDVANILHMSTIPDWNFIAN